MYHGHKLLIARQSVPLLVILSLTILLLYAQVCFKRLFKVNPQLAVIHHFLLYEVWQEHALGDGWLLEGLA